jgi:hypothetical protein
VLSAGNPLVDLSTLAHPLGVAAAGHWHDAEDRASMLARIAAPYREAD